MPRIPHLVLVMFLLPFTLARAQEATPEAAAGWPIEQRCVGEPTTPPDDWTFEGTILMTSPDQLHAYQQGWETPRILAFYGEAISVSGLSPDQRWFVTIDGTSRRVQTLYIFETSAIHVYSTVNDEEYVIEWNNRFTGVQTIIGHQLHWLDNEHFLYSIGDASDEVWFLINPFSGEITHWEGQFNPSWEYFFLSPDGEKALYKNGWNVIDWTLYNAHQEIELSIYDQPVWNPDSSQFVGYTLQQNTSAYTPDYLVLFDLEGHVTDEIFYAGASPAYGDLLSWSPDGRYLAFSFQRRFYIMDMREQLVINTCAQVESYTSTWSPTSSQIAFVDYYNSEYTMQIFDLNTWQRYIVAYHRGDVIGWRADD